MPTLLITGSNRGIGLQFVKSFAADGWRIHACCRQPDRADELKDIDGDIVLHRLDVTDHLRIASLAREVSGESMDILINNAGIPSSSGQFGKIDYDEWGHVFAVNSMAPLNMVEKFIEHISESERKTVVNISSLMGSIDDNSSGDAYIYRTSKAALNMITKSLSLDLEDRGITVAAFNPGWVRTRMGGERATLTPQESVEGMRFVIERLTFKDSGKFFSYDGSLLPW